MSHSYTDLVAWKKPIEIGNVAEGQGKLSPGEFRQFLGTARGSVLELQTQINDRGEFVLSRTRSWRAALRKVTGST